MAESKATAPDFSIALTVDMTEAVELRKRLKEVADPAPSFNDMVVKAAATALREHPRVNGAYRDGKFELYERVNIGVAVAAEDALVVPTVFDADRKSLGQIARDARARWPRRCATRRSRRRSSRAARSRSRTSACSGSSSFTAIINPPQAAILTVGALEKQPAVDETRPHRGPRPDDADAGLRPPHPLRRRRRRSSWRASGSCSSSPCRSRSSAGLSHSDARRPMDHSQDREPRMPATLDEEIIAAQEQGVVSTLTDARAHRAHPGRAADGLQRARPRRRRPRRSSARRAPRPTTPSTRSRATPRASSARRAWRSSPAAARARWRRPTAAPATRARSRSGSTSSCPSSRASTRTATSGSSSTTSSRARSCSSATRAASSSSPAASARSTRRSRRSR